MSDYPVLEEAIIYMKGNIAIDNPSIELYRLLQKDKFGNWQPIKEATSLPEIRKLLAKAEQPEAEMWKARFMWIANNIGNEVIDQLKDHGIPNLISFIDKQLINN